jgi:hypothetical protein
MTNIKAILALLLAATAAGVLAVASSASDRSGTLVVDKNCDHYADASYCTFYSSNVDWAPVGTNIFYLQPESNSSDAILDPPGPGNNKAFGHCNLPDGLNGTCVFAGGTGKFTHFHATLAVTWLGAGVGDGLNWHWEGPYSFSPQ